MYSSSSCRLCSRGFCLRWGLRLLGKSGVCKIFFSCRGIKVHKDNGNDQREEQDVELSRRNSDIIT
ncbi:hypothetical protein JZ751_019616 [Albula glossodonta]|uniref:Uncharacterized protein n=1 Tax=Albula glossodonta TaxID=121402 RepID=A0A8T2NXR1_9TELE|nr:hypothetical protein JZ751_019616 [Albula glossodonta]